MAFASGAYMVERKCGAEEQQLVGSTQMKEAVQLARNGEDPGEMLALTYRSQVVNGFQYVVKVKTANNVFLLLKILQPPNTTRANAQLVRLTVTEQIPIDF